MKKQNSSVLMNCFYCATRMHSEYISWQDARLSVCLSHAGIVSTPL